jgi:putative ABC transport system permease protein
MKLSRADIDYIRRDLRAKGIVDPVLHDELVDHVCCELDELPETNTGFKPAYERLLKKIPQHQLRAVHERTILSDNPNTFMLWRNALRMMWRNMTRQRNYAAISIAGLSIGFMCFAAILLYVYHEVSYDRHFQQTENIYRITMASDVGGSSNHIPTSYPTFGPLLKERFPAVEDFTRIINYKYTRMSPTMRVGDKLFYEDNVIFADSTFFKLFDFPFVSGDPKTCLQSPTAIVITENVAAKYFPDGGALGKTIMFNNKADLEITGVVKNLPSNTHLKFDFIIPMSGIGNAGAFGNHKILDSWQMDWFWTYVLLNDATASSEVEAGINTIAAPNVDPGYKAKFYLQAMGDVHHHSNFDYGTDLTPPGDIDNLYTYISVCALILLISSINFVNISYAMATRRVQGDRCQQSTGCNPQSAALAVYPRGHRY